MDQHARALAAAARQALSSPWHLAVLSGPDAGCVLPLSAQGTTVVGRGELLTDPSVSRHHLSARCLQDGVLVLGQGALNGVRYRSARWGRARAPWRRLRGQRHLGAGSWLAVGEELLELRRRPVELRLAPPPPPAGRPWWALVLAAAMVGALVAGVAVALTRAHGSGSWLAALSGAPFMVLMLVRVAALVARPGGFGRQRGGRGALGRARTGPPGTGGAGGRRRGRDQPPDRAQVLLALAARAAGGPGQPLERGPADQEAGVGAWLDAAGKAPLHLAEGDCVALGGQGGELALSWWGGQVLAQGWATATPVAGGLRLRWGGRQGASAQPASATGATASTATAPPPSTGQGALEAELLVCHEGLAPARALSVLELPGEPPPCGPGWWPALLDLAEQAGAVAPAPGAQAGSGLQPVRHLEDVVAGTDPASISERWRSYRASRDGLRVQLGVAPAQAGVVDLVASGPHALVAGTTGSGKSELLVSWLVQMALAVPPAALSLVLVDYKGGAAFGPLEALPHTAGVLTDLDAAATGRALASLQAEVRRRERLLARHRVKDLSGLPGASTPARLVVVVDEFATLAKEHPEVLADLVRVASQGRSLGIHLVLASQRPGEGLSPTIRANAGLRVCLRVLEAQDSRELLGTDAAWRLPAQEPGVFLLAGDPVPKRAPWCGAEAELVALVEAVRQAAVGASPPWRPWAPQLPTHITRPTERPRECEGVLLARTDLPQDQALGWWSWRLKRPLLVLGSPGSGRSTALESACLGALSQGVGVNAVGELATLERLAACRAARGAVGTVTSAQDPRLVTRLLQLAASGALAGQVLALDDVDHVLAAVDEQLGGGEGAGLLASVLRAASAFGTAVVLSAPLGAASSRWAGGLGLRLVLGACQPFQATAAGLPRGVVTGTGAGRAVVVDKDQALACQVLLPAPGELDPRRWDPPPPGAPEPARLQALPLRVQAQDLPAGAWALAGDHAAPLLAEPGRSVLVAGPAGSGRSNALAALARALPGPVVVADDLDLADAQAAGAVEQALAQGETVVASATTERALAAYRGPLHQLRERGELVVLWPTLGPAHQLAGVGLRGACDLRRPTLPGRGALVRHGTALPLQVALAPQ